MRILLDTSAYSALMRGAEEVARRVRRSEQVLISSIVVGELLFGFRCGSRLERNLAQLEAFLDNPFTECLPVTETTADRFARIARRLREKGTPIPTNDIWIAAHAMESGADLITYDRHFRLVDGVVAIQPLAD